MSEWSVIGLTPRAAYCPAPGPFFRRAPGSRNLVANQLHLYTIREGTVRYSPFSKELSNYKINIFSLSLCAHSRKKTVSPRGRVWGDISFVRRSVFVSERHQLVARMEAVCDRQLRLSLVLDRGVDVTVLFTHSSPLLLSGSSVNHFTGRCLR